MVAKRFGIALAAWLPLYGIAVGSALSLSRIGAKIPGVVGSPISGVLITNLISMGSAGLLGIAVRHICRRWPWPSAFRPTFFLMHMFFALAYAAAWAVAIYVLESLRF